MSSINTNVYYSPSLDIINPSENVPDLGITMSRNCSFDVHINIICKKSNDLSGWILRTFTSRDSTTLMTLFNALIMSRLDYWCSTTMSAVDFERSLEGGRGVEIWVMELWGVFHSSFLNP